MAPQSEEEKHAEDKFVGKDDEAEAMIAAFERGEPIKDEEDEDAEE